MSGAALKRLAEAIGGFATDPFGYCMFSFPWREPGPLQEFDGPRRWQVEVLREIGDHLSNPATRFTPMRIARATGHSVGKSALISMVCCWALDTCVDTRIICTAGKEDQLVTKLAPELSKWRGMSLTKEWWRVETMSHKSAQAGHAHSWRIDLLTWSTSSPEGFAGLHNLSRRIVVVFDEASAIDDAIWDVVLGALVDEQTEIIFLAMGNPTKSSGAFHRCFHAHRHLWSCRQIDARQVEGTNKAYLDELVSTYGEDSNIARVRVKGQFPTASSMTFIGSDVVQAARVRGLPDNGGLLSSDCIIFGLDHARHGSDETVLAIRQGRDARSRPWRSWSCADSIDIAGGVLDLANRFMPDAIFVDAGGPNAGGIIDHLRRQMGDKADRVHEINFGTAHKDMEATDISGLRTRVANRRAQMWVRMRSWLERGAIPDLQKIADDLVAPEYGFDRNDAIQLEKKSHMRARGLASPDWGDALALTFAEELMTRQPEYLNPVNYGRPERGYDRYADLGDDGYDELYERYGTAMPSVLRKSYQRY